MCLLASHDFDNHEQNELLSQYHFGFRQGRVVEQKLTLLTAKNTLGLDKGRVKDELDPFIFTMKEKFEI